MKVYFEPGDGSFEIILESQETVPQEWKGRADTTVLREVAPNIFQVEKEGPKEKRTRR